MPMIVEKYTIVVIETKPDYFIVRCGYCNGRGCSSCNYVGLLLDVLQDLSVEIVKVGGAELVIIVEAYGWGRFHDNRLWQGA